MDWIFELLKVGSFRADSISTKIEATAQSAMRIVQKRLDDLSNFANSLIAENETLRADAKTNADKLEASESSLKERADEVSTLKLAADPAVIEDMVQERIDVLAACQVLDIKTTEGEKKTRIDTSTLMREVVNSVSPEQFRVDDKLEVEALRQRFIGALVSIDGSKRTDQKLQLSNFINNAKGSDGKSEDEKKSERKDARRVKQEQLYNQSYESFAAGPKKEDK